MTQIAHFWFKYYLRWNCLLD